MENKEIVKNISEELEKVKEELGIVETEIDENDDTEDIKSSMEFKLSTGETLKIDLSNLKGFNIINMKKNYRKIAGKKANFFEDLDDGYYSYVAAVMSKISYDKILNLPYQDWLKVKNFVRDYLLAF